MYAMTLNPIPHPLKNNRSAYLNYISHLKESVETVREIVEEARVVKPLDNTLNYACQYTKLSQELLEYVIGTCPKSFNERDNKAPSTPVTRKKQVTFSDKPGTSSSNTQKHEVHQKVQQTNIPVIPSTGVNDSTEASGSKPRSNTKKNRILPAKKENKKEVEVHLRINKTPTKFGEPKFQNLQTRLFSNAGRTGHALVSGLRLFKTYDGKSFKAHEFCGKVHRVSQIRNDHFRGYHGYGDYVFRGVQYDLKSITTWKGLGYESILCVPISLKGSHGSQCCTRYDDEMMEVFSRYAAVQSFQAKSWLWHVPCQLGKSKKFSHRPKSENTNMEVLHTLHMDLCGPMRVQSIKGKKYILVIVDDYSRFTWVKFLRSKDETPEFVTNFLKQIQVGLNKTVRFIRTDNGTEFVNQVMSEYYEGVGIFHQKSVPRTPQQNGVVERRNRTLVEAARTMMIFSKAPMFLWAEAVATACYTQNRSLIHTRHNKTPYELDTSLLQQIAQDAPSTSASSSTSDIAIIHQHQEIAEEPTHEDTPIHHDGTYPKLITTRSSQKMDQRSTSWITWWQSTLSFLYLPENVTIRCFDGAVSTILNCPKWNSKLFSECDFKKNLCHPPEGLKTRKIHSRLSSEEGSI
ncbi:retrovirus-related pol polyprotein from transposon TNT 1-94 [Tanacetum coccineum]